VEGKRILELGSGTGRLAVSLAQQGAKVISVDWSMERVADARAVAEAADVRIEYHHGDLADLAFIRGDQIDLAVSVYALAAVSDLGRVFRQVNRVLRSEATLAISLPHPLALMATLADGGPRLTRTYFDAEPVPWSLDGEEGLVYPHQVGDVVTTLWRSNFRVDSLLEPRIEPGAGPHPRDPRPQTRNLNRHTFLRSLFGHCAPHRPRWSAQTSGFACRHASRRR
jgi:SAM-dependent methyltransferase